MNAVSYIGDEEKSRAVACRFPPLPIKVGNPKRSCKDVCLCVQCVRGICVHVCVLMHVYVHTRVYACVRASLCVCVCLVMHGACGEAGG